MEAGDPALTDFPEAVVINVVYRSSPTSDVLGQYWICFPLLQLALLLAAGLRRQ